MKVMKVGEREVSHGEEPRPPAPVVAPRSADIGTPISAPAGDIERSSRGLRDLLFDQIDRLRNGQCDVGEAKAIAALAGQIVNTVHMEIAIANLRRDYPGDTKLIVPPPLNLNARDGK